MRRLHWTMLLLAATSSGPVAISACGGDDSGTTGGDGGAEVGPEVTADVAEEPEAAVDANEAGDASDAGDAGDTSDAGDAMDAADVFDAAACKALTVTAIKPAQGWNGIDVPVAITGSGFVPCGGDAGACTDEFALVVPCGADAGSDASADAGGDSSADASAADAGDAGACTAAYALTKVVVTSPTSAQAIVPQGGPIGGPYDLRDTQGPCAATLPKAYTILDQTVTVSKIVPAYGWTGDDTPVTVTGTGFVSTPRGFIDVPSMSPADQKLRSTAFVSSTSLTSIAASGLTAGGPYDVKIVNPDYTGGILKNAFTVVKNPIPSIQSVSPSQISTAGGPIVITGCNFRSPLTVKTIDSNNNIAQQTAGALSCNPPADGGPPPCPGGTSLCTLKATIGTIAVGAYVVRLTDNDEGTSGDYSALVVTDPSGKLGASGGWTLSGNHLATKRRSLATVSGRINDASRFLYAIGGEGDTASGANALSSIEVAPLDLYGTLGGWFTQRYTLTKARAGASAVQLGGYVYVFGGTSSSGGTGGIAPTGTALGGIERAKILDLTGVPAVADPAPGAAPPDAGGLPAGSWYYKVAAVRGGGDPDNPNGEELPSDEVVATLGSASTVTLSWTAPKNAANIDHYAIYRSASANGTSQSEVLLDNVTGTTYTDDGSKSPGSQAPLVRGSTGVFQVSTITLTTPRLDSSATIAPDPTGTLFVYITGGWGKCTGQSVAGGMKCYEYAPITSDGKTLGVFTQDSTHTFDTARFRHGSAPIDAADGYSNWPSGKSFVIVAGGYPSTLPQATAAEYAAVNPGGQLGAFTALSTQYGTKRDGTQILVANSFAYVFLGGSNGNYAASTEMTGIADVTTSPITTTSWSSASQSLATGEGRMGMTLESAYFYAIGGTTDDLDALDSVYTILY